MNKLNEMLQSLADAQHYGDYDFLDEHGPEFLNAVCVDVLETVYEIDHAAAEKIVGIDEETQQRDTLDNYGTAFWPDVKRFFGLPTVGLDEIRDYVADRLSNLEELKDLD